MTRGEETRNLRGAGGVRHVGAFVLAGAAAFFVDAAVLTILTRLVQLDPLLARLPAIALAMVTSWRINRRLTFQVARPPSVREFLRFAAVAAAASIVNYAVYAALLLAGVINEPLLALVLASGAAMGFAYLGMRFGVFRKRLPDE